MGILAIDVMSRYCFCVFFLSHGGLYMQATIELVVMVVS